MSHPLKAVAILRGQLCKGCWAWWRPSATTAVAVEEDWEPMASSAIQWVWTPQQSQLHESPALGREILLENRGSKNTISAQSWSPPAMNRVSRKKKQERALRQESLRERKWKTGLLSSRGRRTAPHTNVTDRRTTHTSVTDKRTVHKCYTRTAHTSVTQEQHTSVTNTRTTHMSVTHTQEQHTRALHTQEQHTWVLLTQEQLTWVLQRQKPGYPSFFPQGSWRGTEGERLLLEISGWCGKANIFMTAVWCDDTCL